MTPPPPPRRRRPAQAQLLQPGQEAFLLLAAKYPEHELRGIRRAAPRHHSENESGEIGVIEVGDAAPFLPLRLAAATRPLGPRHRRILAPVLVSASLCRACQ